MHTITKEELENIKYNTEGYLDEILRLLDEVIECEFTTIKEINLHSQKTTDIIIRVSIDLNFIDEVDDEVIRDYAEKFNVSFNDMRTIIRNNIIWTVESDNIGYLTSISNYIEFLNNGEYWLDELLINEIYKQID